MRNPRRGRELHYARNHRCKLPLGIADACVGRIAGKLLSDSFPAVTFAWTDRFRRKVTKRVGARCEIVFDVGNRKVASGLLLHGSDARTKKTRYAVLNRTKMAIEDDMWLLNVFLRNPIPLAESYGQTRAICVLLYVLSVMAIALF